MPPLHSSNGALAYPPAPQSDAADQYHGVTIADPFRPLEDLDAEGTRAWIEAQNALTEAYLSSVPGRSAIRARLERLWDYTKCGVPFREGGRYFYFKNEGLQNRSVLFTSTALDGEQTVLLDPNLLSSDGTVALGAVFPSRDGALLAYSLSASGSDWQDWHVRRVADATDLPDIVRWSKFSEAAWLHDGSGFFYARFAEPEPGETYRAANFNHRVYLHRLGTDQSADELVYERPDQPEWTFNLQVTDDGRYLVLHVHHGTDPKNRIFYRDLSQDGSPFVELLNAGDAMYAFLGNVGARFFFRSSRAAARGCILAIDLASPHQADMLVPEMEHALEGASFTGGRFFAEYTVDARTQVTVYAVDGRRLSDVALPGLGSASGFGGTSTDTDTFYGYTSFTQPFTVYRYDIARGTSELVFEPQAGFSAADYTSEQVFYASKDGTRIPMTIVAKRGTPRDGSAPTILYGYGGFDISLTPAFSPSIVAWADMGGVYAVANLRGGGEYGQAWHESGMLERKQNVFDDAIAAAEYLIAEKVTSRDKLAVMGRSNGGLLVGALMTQRPELFAAALPGVGVMDMLRFHKFTIGWAWTVEYGSADEAEHFPTLRAYSPLHNIRPGTEYPPTLVTTGDHDDRVFPAHSYKFAAALQQAQGGSGPVLIRVDTKAGHGAGKPTAKLIDETADGYAFLARVLHMDQVVD